MSSVQFPTKRAESFVVSPHAPAAARGARAERARTPNHRFEIEYLGPQVVFGIGRALGVEERTKRNELQARGTGARTSFRTVVPSAPKTRLSPPFQATVLFAPVELEA